MSEVILVFASVHYTLRAEELLKKETLSFQVVPVPPHLNGGCGLGIKIEEKERKRAVSYLGENGVTVVKTALIKEEG